MILRDILLEDDDEYGDSLAYVRRGHCSALGRVTRFIKDNQLAIVKAVSERFDMDLMFDELMIGDDFHDVMEVVIDIPPEALWVEGVVGGKLSAKIVGLFDRAAEFAVQEIKGVPLLRKTISAHRLPEYVFEASPPMAKLAKLNLARCRSAKRALEEFGEATNRVRLADKHQVFRDIGELSSIMLAQTITFASSVRVR